MHVSNFINNEDYNNYLDNFIKLYKTRPIKNNKGGMLFQHMFFVHIILKKINPSCVIESGVFKGQSTWLIKNTLPKCKVISLDIDLRQREYINEKVDYKNQDFSKLNFKDTKNTLLFLDDHINHYERIKDAYFYGIKHVILEDNYKIYDPKKDFYTLDHILNNEGFIHTPSFKSYLKTFYLFSKMMIKKILSKNYNCEHDLLEIKGRIRDVCKKNSNLENIKNVIDFYFIFPNIKDKIISSIKNNIFEIEMSKYNFLTYVKLK